jgi:hypothetical protein
VATTTITPVSPASFSSGYLTLPCTSSGCSASTPAVFNMQNSTLFAKVSQIPGTGAGGIQSQFRAQYDTSNYFGWRVLGGILYFDLCQAGTLVIDTYGSYANLGPYWRIRVGTPVFPLNLLGWVNLSDPNFGGSNGSVDLNGNHAALPSISPGTAIGTGLLQGITTGDAIILVATGYSYSNVNLGFGDSRGNSYTRVLTSSGGSNNSILNVWVANNCTTLSPKANDTIFFDYHGNWPISSGPYLSYSAWSAPGYYTLDTDTIATGTSTTPSVATGTMSIAGDMEVSFFSNYAGLDPLAAPSGWAEAVTPGNGKSKVANGSYTAHAYWKYATGTTTDTVTATYPSSTEWITAALTLKTNLGSGTVYWDNSFDGTSWTNLYSRTHVMTATQLQNMLAYFSCGYSGTEYGPEPMLVGGINVI